AFCITVVGHLVPRPLAQLPADLRRRGAVGRQPISHRPVTRVLSRRLRRVIASANHPRPWNPRKSANGSLHFRGEGPSGLRVVAKWPHHQTVPPGEIFASLIPSPLDRAAFLDSRYLSAAIWSCKLCCSTLPASPLAFFGPA